MPDEPAKEDKGFRRRLSKSVGLQICLSLIAAVIFFCCYSSGRAGDCKPHEIDGQCGLSTFAGLLFGLGGAAVIVFVSVIAILVAAYRRGDEP
jgi:hypothetical protein